MDDVVDKPAVLALQLYEIAGYISNNLPCLPVELAKTNTNTGEALRRPSRACVKPITPPLFAVCTAGATCACMHETGLDYNFGDCCGTTIGLVT
jgi:hypothetical protein